MLQLTLLFGFFFYYLVLIKFPDAFSGKLGYIKLPLFMAGLATQSEPYLYEAIYNALLAEDYTTAVTVTFTDFNSKVGWWIINLPMGIAVSISFFLTTKQPLRGVTWARWTAVLGAAAHVLLFVYIGYLQYVKGYMPAYSGVFLTEYVPLEYGPTLNSYALMGVLLFLQSICVYVCVFQKCNPLILAFNFYDSHIQASFVKEDAFGQDFSEYNIYYFLVGLFVTNSFLCGCFTVSNVDVYASLIITVVVVLPFLFILYLVPSVTFRVTYFICLTCFLYVFLLVFTVLAFIHSLPAYDSIVDFTRSGINEGVPMDLNAATFTWLQTNVLAFTTNLVAYYMSSFYHVFKFTRPVQHLFIPNTLSLVYTYFDNGERKLEEYLFFGFYRLCPTIEVRFNYGGMHTRFIKGMDRGFPAVEYNNCVVTAKLAAIKYRDEILAKY